MDVDLTAFAFGNSGADQESTPSNSHASSAPGSPLTRVNTFRTTSAKLAAILSQTNDSDSDNSPRPQAQTSPPSRADAAPAPAAALPVTSTLSATSEAARRTSAAAQDLLAKIKASCVVDDSSSTDGDTAAVHAQAAAALANLARRASMAASRSPSMAVPTAVSQRAPSRDPTPPPPAAAPPAAAAPTSGYEYDTSDDDTQSNSSVSSSEANRGAAAPTHGATSHDYSDSSDDDGSSSGLDRGVFAPPGHATTAAAAATAAPPPATVPSSIGDLRARLLASSSDDDDDDTTPPPSRQPAAAASRTSSVSSRSELYVTPTKPLAPSPSPPAGAPAPATAAASAPVPTVIVDGPSVARDRVRGGRGRPPPPSAEVAAIAAVVASDSGAVDTALPPAPAASMLSPSYDAAVARGTSRDTEAGRSERGATGGGSGGGSGGSGGGYPLRRVSSGAPSDKPHTKTPPSAAQRGKSSSVSSVDSITRRRRARRRRDSRPSPPGSDKSSPSDALQRPSTAPDASSSPPPSRAVDGVPLRGRRGSVPPVVDDNAGDTQRPRAAPDDVLSSSPSSPCIVRGARTPPHSSNPPFPANAPLQGRLRRGSISPSYSGSEARSTTPPRPPSQIVAPAAQRAAAVEDVAHGRGSGGREANSQSPRRGSRRGSLAYSASSAADSAGAVAQPLGEELSQPVARGAATLRSYIGGGGVAVGGPRRVEDGVGGATVDHVARGADILRREKDREDVIAARRARASASTHTTSATGEAARSSDRRASPRRDRDVRRNDPPPRRSRRRRSRSSRSSSASHRRYRRRRSDSDSSYRASGRRRPARRESPPLRGPHRDVEQARNKASAAAPAYPVSQDEAAGEYLARLTRSLVRDRASAMSGAGAVPSRSPPRALGGVHGDGGTLTADALRQRAAAATADAAATAGDDDAVLERALSDAELGQATWRSVFANVVSVYTPSTGAPKVPVVGPFRDVPPRVAATMLVDLAMACVQAVDACGTLVTAAGLVSAKSPPGGPLGAADARVADGVRSEWLSAEVGRGVGIRFAGPAAVVSAAIAAAESARFSFTTAYAGPHELSRAKCSLYALQHPSTALEVRFSAAPVATCRALLGVAASLQRAAHALLSLRIVSDDMSLAPDPPFGGVDDDHDHTAPAVMGGAAWEGSYPPRNGYGAKYDASHCARDDKASSILCDATQRHVALIRELGFASTLNGQAVPVSDAPSPPRGLHVNAFQPSPRPRATAAPAVVFAIEGCVSSSTALLRVLFSPNTVTDCLVTAASKAAAARRAARTRKELEADLLGEVGRADDGGFVMALSSILDAATAAAPHAAAGDVKRSVAAVMGELLADPSIAETIVRQAIQNV